MSRLTGRPEIVKAAVESIAFQITDVLNAMIGDSGMNIKELRVDGGATNNKYLMQFQSDLAGVPVQVPGIEELSASGVAYLSGIAADLYDKAGVFKGISYETYEPGMDEQKKQTKYAAWRQAVELVLGSAKE
jgi:glycerol kinase